MPARIHCALSLCLIFAMLLPDAVFAVDEEAAPVFTNIVLQLGADESKMNFIWYSLSDDEGTITFAKATDLVDGAFPADMTVVTAQRTKSVKESYYANKATIEGLVPETD